MTKEIKEILNELSDKCKYIEDYGYQYKRISLEDIELLLDYITNLQQENERLLKKSYSDDVKITKAIKYIEKQKKRKCINQEIK